MRGNYEWPVTLPPKLLKDGFQIQPSKVSLANDRKMTGDSKCQINDRLCHLSPTSNIQTEFHFANNMVRGRYNCFQVTCPSLLPNIDKLDSDKLIFTIL